MFGKIAVVLCALTASGAQALSCLPHDVAAVFHQANTGEDRFVVVLGHMSFDATLLPKTDLANQLSTPPDTRIPAQIRGKALTAAGFTYDYDAAINLNAQCLGPWCAGAVSDTQYLAFVNLDRDVPEVTINPCGGFAFAEPTKAMADQVVQCLNGGTCEPRQHR
ncbi:hypothetical protein Q4577_08940 [Marinovum sp. 2_MG-2023]|uniref:hypothetical protein n=1 Tax=unclassified Marinovum TaxID=2647166 RepID=UPI0026E354F6|nr:MULTISPECIES: hypothetical protein [unclassified Marinovum]MDO6730143.1 hypothetical protein [Marinovum sp. 2_MG-2023]MDO6778881.1 hypothetical protein [Marinovum sp. 1_MG-2023]